MRDLIEVVMIWAAYFAGAVVLWRMMLPKDEGRIISDPGSVYTILSDKHHHRSHYEEYECSN